MASCMEQHCKHIVNWVKPHLQKSTWKQSLLDTEFGVPSVVLKLLRTWTWGGLSPYYNTTSIMMPRKFCELGFFLIKEADKDCQHPTCSSMVPRFLLLCLLPLPSSPTVLSQFLSLYKALVCLQPEWMLFYIKESNKTRKSNASPPESCSLTCCTNSHSKKGSCSCRSESAKAWKVDESPEMS